VSWQGRPQPYPRSAIAITLTLRLQSGGPSSEYTRMTTDASVVFTVPVGSLPSGSYYWRVKDPKYLATSGSVTLAGAPVANVEMGRALAKEVPQAKYAELAGLGHFLLLEDPIAVANHVRDFIAKV